MSGLYTRSNLSEGGLNATDALQKLYEPQVQSDILLFAFSSSLVSGISSGDKIFGLVNEPISDLSGLTLNRTKIVTTEFTFSDGTEVWFDRVFSSIQDIVKVPINRSVVNLTVQGQGLGYVVRGQDGTEISSYPATVEVNLLGAVSGSRSAVAQITVNGNGTISYDSEIVNGGSGYIIGERVEILPKCLQGESPLVNNCFEYSGEYYIDQEPSIRSSKASIVNSNYPYTVKSSGLEGFFLYDEKEEEWLYLGEFYDTFRGDLGDIKILRDDSITPDNISQLFRLNFRSYFYSYRAPYQLSDNLQTTLSSVQNSVESVDNDLRLFVQNTRAYKTKSDEDNVLGFDYNIFEGFNLLSDYRIVFRDPDGVIDRAESDFFSLRDNLSGQNQYVLDGATVPGIWLFSGDKYQRAFSTDDKPFIKQSGSKYLSPLLFAQSGDPLPESGGNKYSISGPFDTEISTLIQAIPGGFVYHRPLTVTTSGSIKLWPLLSYKSSSGSPLDARFLAL